ncbi:MAG TPA: hypothetical protein VGK53_11160 [Propionicimonas sp.]
MTNEDLFQFQRKLFEAVYAIDSRWDECSRARKRLSEGKAVQLGAPDLPAGADVGRVESWELELFVAGRVARQLRTVGDALAWRTFDYDRRVIIALSRNEPAGPMAGKAGLPYELGRVQELWEQSGHFGLLHDLTTCVRIADVTEVTPAGFVLHEVKKKRRVPRTQLARAQAAVNAIMSDGPLLGGEDDTRIAVLTTRFRADMKPLVDAIRLARERGAQGIGLPEGRVLFVASITDLLRLHGDDFDGAVQTLQKARASAIRRAGLDHSTGHWVGNSGDTAGRSPVSAPLGIFPLSAQDRADLICDTVTFELVLSVEALVEHFQERKMSARLLLPEASLKVDPADDVIQISYGDRGLTVNSASTQQLLFELLRPSAWCDGLLETLRLSSPPTHPVIVFSHERDTWR